MPDREVEAQHLVEADRHIAEAEERVAHVSDLIADAERRGADTGEARTLQKTITEALEGLRTHRALIVQRIADAEAGRP